MKYFMLTIFSVFATNCLFAQKEEKTKPPKVGHALKITTPIKIDGKLDEAIWQQAETLTDFVQREPSPGEAPTHQTEVKILYDNTALYVGAFMHEDSKENVLRELSLRDDWNNTDWFEIDIDAYQSGVNADGFWITAAGVQGDSKYTSNGEDTNWDAVWESKVQVTDKGWIVEMKIPYSAIRFPDKNVQEWGLNFIRQRRQNREFSNWNPVNPNQAGYVNQFGILKGIENIKPPVRLSLTPYVSTGIDIYSDRQGNERSTTTLFSGGADVKYGITDAFTLDVTLVPDFTQVQSDDQVLNLSPFEIRFDERRAFFTEGTELFEKANLFYSRRAGSTPIGYYDVEANDGETIVENPNNSQLINATKLSGRTNKGLGIGVFNAVTLPTDAVIRNDETGEERRIRTSPLTNYNVIAFDQILKNNSYVSFVNTNVWRGEGFYDANVTGTEFRINTKNNKYAVWGSGSISQKYYKDAKNEIGHTYNLTAGKVSGNWWYQLRYNEESHTYDRNDLGFLYNNNERSMNLATGYNINKPFGKFRRMWSNLNIGHGRLYKPNKFTNFNINPSVGFNTKKFFSFGSWININPIGYHDYFEPREDGRVFKDKPLMHGGIWTSTDYRKKFAFDFNSQFTKVFGDIERYRYRYQVSPRYRVNDRLSFVARWSHEMVRNIYGYATHLEQGDGSEKIIFGKRNVDTYNFVLASQYMFNDLMGLTFRSRYYWARVPYHNFHELLEDGSLQAHNYDGLDEDGEKAHDQNFNAFTIDLVYTWRFAPGSELSAVWKNSIYASDNNGDLPFTDSFRNLRSPQNNVLSLKVVYFLDYVQAKGWAQKRKARKRTEN